MDHLLVRLQVIRAAAGTDSGSRHRAEFAPGRHLRVSASQVFGPQSTKIRFLKLALQDILELVQKSNGTPKI